MANVAKTISNLKQSLDMAAGLTNREDLCNHLDDCKFSQWASACQLSRAYDMAEWEITSLKYVGRKSYPKSTTPPSFCPNSLMKSSFYFTISKDLWD